MVFADLAFLYVFLPLNLLLYFVSKNNTWRNTVLTAFSLFFYAWGEPVWIVLLLFSATIDYLHGLGILRFRGTPMAKWMVVSSLVLNLGLLAVFKYSGFFVDTITAITGITLSVPSFSLPIGISFYTFQTISYVVDAYKGRVEPQRSFSKFLMYVSMYPQLVAGPIVRYEQIALEIENRNITLNSFSRGVSRFCVGLFKKVFVANHAGALAALYLDGDFSSLSTAGAWFGLLLFTLQIYYDFSGYSDMAIGLGGMFGFSYPENFNYPYISKSVTEFWRRWHISLGSFFRDYVYIPLGGNRHMYLRNLLVVWFLTGMWHGASWNFVLWGLFYGIMIMIERKVFGGAIEKIPVISNIYTMLMVMLGWALFYFTDLSRLWQFLQLLFGAGTADATLVGVTLLNNLFWLIAAVLFCLPILPWLQKTLGRALPTINHEGTVWPQVLANVVMLIVGTALLVGQSYNPFLYFRF